jgi:hypothetical protein
MSIFERKPFKNFFTLRAFAYVKKETHVEIYELQALYFNSSGVLAVPGTVAFKQPSNYE